MLVLTQPPLTPLYNSMQVLVTSDPLLLHQMAHSQRGCFEARNLPITKTHQPNPTPSHVFNAQGQQWKQLRQETARAFTINAMKRLLPMIQASVEALFASVPCGEEVDIHPYLVAIAQRLMAHIAVGDAASAVPVDSANTATADARPPAILRRFTRLPPTLVLLDV